MADSPILPGSNAVQSGTAKAAGVFWDWGIPLAALGIGYVMRDFLNVKAIVTNLLTGRLPVVGTVDTIGLLTAGLFAAIAVGIWRGIGGYIGKIVGFFFIGVALGVLKDALNLTP